MLRKSNVAAAAVAGAVALAAGTATLASQAASAGTAGEMASASAVPRCVTRHLSAGLHGFQVGLGNRGFILTLTNAGNSACSLDGYPGLGLEDAAHQMLPSHTHWGDTYFDPQNPGRRLIVLSPGETVSADFAFGAGTGGSTDSVATYLAVTPPNAFKHLTVLLPGAPVRIDHGRLFVTAMARHTPYHT
jgi:hypothetical protein